ncbi:ferredoxin [Microbispora sp. NPDC046933]|uniref:4Fe-4S domain-containing protein n=1 Tax=Microbispora sp. NPDC046933 TaxID=3155618 RepID=UPI0033CB18EB
MIDQYERSAEFVDIMLAAHWSALGPALVEALHGGAGPIVDVGAGGGHGTRAIAQAVPGAEVVAVEPSPALRSVLLARVNESPELRDRVTVLPGGLLQAELPPRLGAVVAMNVIGHFTPAERHLVWDLLARRLLPAGRAVVNLQPPAEPVRVPQARFSDLRIGRRRYEGWGRAEPAGPGQITWHMTYRTFQDGHLTEETAVEYAWWVLGEDRLRAELGEHGLRLDPTGPAELGMYVITRAPEQRSLIVAADTRVCVGAGQCVLAAPDVFDQDAETGLVVVLDEAPPAPLAGAVRRAAHRCPSGAVTVRDELR